MSPQAEIAARGVDRDSDLVEALRRREPTAAEQLVNTYGERAYRLTAGITGNGQDAEEAVQDAFWTVIRKIDSFRGDSAFRSWLYRIVANAACQKLRGRRSRRRDLSWDDVQPSFDEEGRHIEPTADWSARATDPAVQTELREALTSAVNQLPPVSRTVVVLRDVEGLSSLEVAKILGLSVPNVKTRVHRARLFLRKQLSGLMTLDGRQSVPAIRAEVEDGQGHFRGASTGLSRAAMSATGHAGQLRCARAHGG